MGGLYKKIGVMNCVNTCGLDPLEATALRDLVDRLYDNIDAVFSPGYCRAVPGRTDDANLVLARAGHSLCEPLSNFFEPLTAKRWKREHFFWHAKLRSTAKDIILDPAGVPADLRACSVNTIKPYFGLLEHAPQPHIRVYRAMEEMDDWGTRDLRPGFHP